MERRRFEEGETYYVLSDEGTCAIVRPHYTQVDTGDNCIVKGQCLNNMNYHWGKDDFVRPDGVCTHPWGLSDGVSVQRRETRLATELESMMLDRTIETGGALSVDEMRDVKLCVIGV